jgi:phosphopantothenoylcysteine decarboxylase/phosphopantothenate--cysteine ligase
MSKYKILLKISGSIAAYKSAYLLSKFVQNNFEVQVVTTPSALEFIGKATIEGLSGKPVLVDQYEDGKMMNHIDLIKWADLIILCPASANTINKMANGIGDNLVTSLFIAYDFNKPYLVAPAMNVSMYNHPVTQNSLSKLKKFGITILPTDTGYLACGDYGEGKLIDPDYIFNEIIKSVTELEADDSDNTSILITAGATREQLDSVRFISNLSTGTTASSMADYLSQEGFNITYLHGLNSSLPKNLCQLEQFTDFKNLKSKIRSLLKKRNFDLVIHSAAVSDFTVDTILKNNRVIKKQKDLKIKSGSNLNIKLKPTEKIVDDIKTFSKNKKLTLISFKFMVQTDLSKAKIKVKELFQHSNSDYVVLNFFQDRIKTSKQTNFYIFNDKMIYSKVENSIQLADNVKKIINKEANAL